MRLEEGDPEIMFLDELHKRAGVCGHCGKRRCPERKSWSTLPETIPTKAVLAAFTKAMGRGDAYYYRRC